VSGSKARQDAAKSIAGEETMYGLQNKTALVTGAFRGILAFSLAAKSCRTLVVMESVSTL
jgi:hypothetical protein